MTDNFASLIDEKEPMLWQHVERCYNALYDLAKEEEHDGITLLVFRGKTTEVFRSLGISQQYYSPVFKQLEQLGSIVKVQRGTKGQDSVIAIRDRPTLEAWREIRGSRDLTPKVDLAILTGRVNEITKQMGGVNLVEAFSAVETRLNQLTKEISELKERISVLEA